MTNDTFKQITAEIEIARLHEPDAEGFIAFVEFLFEEGLRPYQKDIIRKLYKRGKWDETTKPVRQKEQDAQV